MFFRIQTFYLFIASLCSGVLSFFLPLKLYYDNTTTTILDQYEYLLLFAFSTILSIIAIFQYNKRQNQYVLGRLNMIINLILLGLFVCRSLINNIEYYNFESGVGFLLPVITILLLVLANRAIKKDEELVKSVDRLR
tara:strand:+ start:429 stop:839 length:411 start_codon:yes stop_codon:yes gene_type:complete